MKKYLKRFFNKKVIWTVVIVLVVIGIWALFFNKKSTEEILVVKSGEFLQQVSASGTIVPKSDLDLSFEQAGQVTKVYVKVGDHVQAGQLLANQNTKELNAQVAQMEAGIEIEQAKLNQLMAGASNEDIQTAKDAVDYAKQNLANAYADSINAIISASSDSSDASTLVLRIKKTYFMNNEAESIRVDLAKATIDNSAKNIKKYLDIVQNNQDANTKDMALIQVNNDLEVIYSNLAAIRQICEIGIYYSNVSASDKALLDTQKTTITTTTSSVTDAQTSINSYKVALTQAQSALALKQSPARNSDIAIYQAQIKQAQANLQNVLAQLGKRKIFSPINGIVSAVNAKEGMIISSSDVAFSVISKNSFQIDSYVPEINISLVGVDQPATVTLDAYGANTFFDAKVISIDPAETIKDGVSTYKITLEFLNQDDPRIKSGMTGNIIITTLKKANVLSIPQGTIIMKNGKSFVKIKVGEIVDEKEVTTGAIASNGNIEILSGLSEGTQVIVK